MLCSAGKRRTNSSGFRQGPIHLSFMLKNTHPEADEFELSRVTGFSPRVLMKSIISV